jgi:hypothetical protein
MPIQISALSPSAMILTCKPLYIAEAQLLSLSTSYAKFTGWSEIIKFMLANISWVPWSLQYSGHDRQAEK